LGNFFLFGKIIYGKIFTFLEAILINAIKKYIKMYLNLKKKNSFLFDQKAFLTVCERFGSSVMNRKYAINAKK
jgi:hypothetical protein